MLVDTSVWIRHLAGRGDTKLVDALRRESVLGHELVAGELLIGDRGGRRAWLVDYARMPMAPMLSHAEVTTFVRSRRLHGRGIGWIAAHLLAAALVARAALWTADVALAALADEIGVGETG